MPLFFSPPTTAARNRALLTGIKETQKALRRATPGNTSGSSSNAKPSTAAAPKGVVVIAADTYPWDIISHMPVLCEEANVPYIYVRSREELGRASGSNRIQTSAMMILAEKGVNKKSSSSSKKEEKAGKEKASGKDGEVTAEEYAKTFGKFLGLVKSAQDRVKI